MQVKRRVKDMDQAELRRYIKMLAHGLAAKSYQRAQPTAPEAEAWAYAGRHWQQHLEQAFELAALLEASREAEDAAPFN